VGKWLTPDSIPTERVCRVLSIPASSDWLAIVSGAVLELAKLHNWEEYGDLTAVEASDEAANIFADYYDERPCMLGAIIAYATSQLPDGTLACDGQTYNKSDYPRLYDSLDSAYIVDGSSFRVPDLRGRTVIGVGTGSGLTARAVDDNGGEEQHALTTAELAVHSHTINSSIVLYTVGPAPAAVLGGIPPITATNPAGSGTAHENMQPWRALKYAIVAR
jgi:microcystin-dependent protein